MSAVRCAVWERLFLLLAQAEENADIAALAALRLVDAARIESERLRAAPWTETQAVVVVKAVCARREEAALAFEGAGRSDLAEIERTDAVLIATLLGSRG